MGPTRIGVASAVISILCVIGQLPGCAGAIAWPDRFYLRGAATSWSINQTDGFGVMYRTTGSLPYSATYFIRLPLNGLVHLRFSLEGNSSLSQTYGGRLLGLNQIGQRVVFLQAKHSLQRIHITQSSGRRRTLCTKDSASNTMSRCSSTATTRSTLSTTSSLDRIAGAATSAHPVSSIVQFLACLRAF